MLFSLFLSTCEWLHLPVATFIKCILIKSLNMNFRIKCNEADTIIVNLTKEDMSRTALNVSGSWPPTRKKIRLDLIILLNVVRFVTKNQLLIKWLSEDRKHPGQRLFNISISRLLSSEQYIPSQTDYQSNKNTWIIIQTTDTPLAWWFFSISPCSVITYFLQLGLDHSMKDLNPMFMELHGQVEENSFENVVLTCNIF